MSLESRLRMKFECYPDLKSLPKYSDDLFLAAERESIFLSRLWFSTLIDYALKPDQSTLFACVESNDQMLLMLPLLQQVDGSLRALSNHYSTTFGVLSRTSHIDGAALEVLVAGVKGLKFEALRIEPMVDPDHRFSALMRMFGTQNFQVNKYFRFYNWFHNVNGQSFVEYMAQRPSSLKNTISRKEKKLRREHDFHICMFTDHDIDRALADYYSVYSASWKSGELFADFKPNLVRRGADRGWLRLGVLYVDKQPVAAQIWFVLHGKANIFRLAYDEAWKKYSPGSILTRNIMEHVIDTDKVAEIDFLTGNERYKRDWMSECRECYGLRLQKPRTPITLLARTKKFLCG